ncbi:unnamed protein product [Prorocentrum cordatum]|uniref:USP domain-containing protein n=1 Tax=Prorocentrum cordatum TaxID=2364126 RepID=A0ABN9XE80_9DINO|nr:unnamed protein product [Polarella glacialis]
MEIQAGASGDEAEQDEDERFYTEHRDELLSALRGGCGFSGGEMFNRLEQRGDGGVGIANQGATCYMNSLLQVLFHTPDFRSAIYSFSHDAARHGDEARCIPLQLQRLFARMQLSRARAVSTTGLTDACGMSGHTNEQHDVQELCRVLFDALGRSSVPLRKDIERLYEGRLVQYVRTREPHDGRTYESSRKESVLDLQVPIVGCRTLEEALRKLVEPEELTGDNQWQCDELGTKVDALKGLEFESLPQILHLQLMRFIFDFQSMRRKKLTDNLSI